MNLANEPAVADRATGTADLYVARRARLLNDLARTGGVAILPTAPSAIRNHDAEYPYRYDSSFYYLSGFPEPEAWLVLDGTSGESILFCREKNVEREIWEGFHYGPDTA
ncbi:MAG TPA: aminopeptidase P N-terminal domain-containing protein, partial [Pararobbsia sp.]|nr:aminopeptidase P N-terminal domain-containing protein [Pararobbsia sp.]